MSVYNVQLSQNPVYPYRTRTGKETLARDNLLGLATAAYGFFDGDLDTYFRLSDKALRPIDLVKVLSESKTIYLDAQDADFDELDEIQDRWLSGLAELSTSQGGTPKRITKAYTAYFDFPNPLVVQFDSLDFIDGIHTFLTWIGETPERYLRFLYRGDQALDL